jgi:SPP1 gp7 family putative phage head morphogenesis protein
VAIDPAAVVKPVPNPLTKAQRLEALVANIVANAFEIHAAENALVNVFDGLLLDLFREISEEITATAILPGQEYRLGRLVDRLTRKIVENQGSWTNGATAQLTHWLGEIGASQAQWASVGMLEGTGATFTLAAPGLSPTFFRALLSKSPFPDDASSGMHLLSDWVEGVGRSTVDKVEGQVRLGMIRGETTDAIVRRIRGRATGKRKSYRLKPTKEFPKGRLRFVSEFEGGVYETQTRSAEAIARTATNHISNQAHLEVYEANDDIVKGIEFVATLDENTTDICMALDGTVWAVGSPNIQAPPRHFRCRSVLAPVIDWDEEGLDFSDTGKKASQFGPVKGSLSYSDWLAKQSTALQNKALGPTRAKAFREGSLSLTDLVNKDGGSRTLKTLRQMQKVPPKEGSGN